MDRMFDEGIAAWKSKAWKREQKMAVEAINRTGSLHEIVTVVDKGN